jgi:hypothetical protein
MKECTNFTSLVRTGVASGRVLREGRPFSEETPIEEMSSGRTDEVPRELESRPMDDTQHKHHSDVYEGPASVDDTRISRFTAYEWHTTIEETRHSPRADMIYHLEVNNFHVKLSNNMQVI